MVEVSQCIPVLNNDKFVPEKKVKKTIEQKLKRNEIINDAIMEI